MKRELSTLLRGWYEIHKRDLRWRHTRDPYRIWLSETILQQTRVQQGAAYYDRFVEHYPTVEALASAPEDDVLKLWQGLGYYARARHLHAAAQQVVARFNGEFPYQYDQLRQLPGIGDYTASAISSIAHNEPHAVVDGNVYRLYARLFDIDTPIDTTAGQRAFKVLAQELLDEREAGEHNQALMEFGALLCTPSTPRCDECPLEGHCMARAHGTVAERPVKQRGLRIRDRYLHYLHLTAQGHTLIRRRETRDIWQGLYEFPMVESAAAIEGFEALELPLPMAGKNYLLKKERLMAPHLLSHQRLHARFYQLEMDTLPHWEGCIEIPEESLGEYAIPRLIERYIEEERGI